MTDLNKAAMLLHVCDKAKNWPLLKGVHDAAMHELGLLNAEALNEAKEREEEAKAKLAAAQKEAAEKIEAAAKVAVKPVNGNGSRRVEA